MLGKAMKLFYRLIIEFSQAIAISWIAYLWPVSVGDKPMKTHD